MIKNNANMRKIRITDVFKQYSCKFILNQYLSSQRKIWFDTENYGYHYYVNYQASIENGISFTIQKRLGKRYVDNINVFSTINDIFKSYYQRFQGDVQTLTEYHNGELNYLGKVGFLDNFIHKNKKDKIKYHEDKLRELQELTKNIDTYKPLSDDTSISYYDIYETSVSRYNSICVIDTRNIEDLKIEQVMVNRLVPFVDKNNQISIIIKITSFDIDIIDMVNVIFNEGHAEIEKGYNVFTCQQKAYDFAIEELMKHQYKDKIKMKLKVAQKLDRIFG